MDRVEARLSLEGNPIFTDLRMERDTLKETNAEMLEALETVSKLPGFEPDEPYGVLVRAAIAKAKGV